MTSHAAPHPALSRHLLSNGEEEAGPKTPQFPQFEGDKSQNFPNKINAPNIFSSSPIFPPVDSTPSRPRIHLTMRCQARRGRRRERGLSQIQDPGPLQRSPSGRGAGTKVLRSDAAKPDTPIGRTCLRGTQTRRPRCREHPDSGANKTAGMSQRIANDPISSPGRGPRSVWCTIRREPPGPPARLKRHPV